MIPYGYRKTGFKSLEKPSVEHWLGVDQSTRDVAVRMLYGTRIALSIGVIAVSIYVTIGVFIGSMAGFFGGIVDLLVVRFIEIFMSIPSLFVILTLLAFVEKPSYFSHHDGDWIVGVDWGRPFGALRVLEAKKPRLCQRSNCIGIPDASDYLSTHLAQCVRTRTGQCNVWCSCSDSDRKHPVLSWTWETPRFLRGVKPCPKGYATSPGTSS